ncbi:hypothetical protein AB6A40_009068 [Gnathostoma spinigerum]|uniref:Non-structural maintenance of chromosomes element 4 n=1 Tax=Gnathostoma spinigerum TaxID=75299 RepID=A0ABD6EVZ6_9BILA
MNEGADSRVKELLENFKKRFRSAQVSTENREAALKLLHDIEECNENESRKERRKLRNDYLKMLWKFEDLCKILEENGGIPDDAVCESLENELEELNSRYPKINALLGGEENAYDAKVLKSLTKFAVGQALALHNQTGMRIQDVAVVLQKAFSFDEIVDDNSDMLSSEIPHPNLLNTPAIMPSLLSLFPPPDENDLSVPQKRKISTKNTEERNIVHLKRIEPSEAITDSDESLASELDRVRRCLKRKLDALDSDRMNYFEFVLHPDDFSRSVENIFYTSFLVKENVVSLDFSSSNDNPDIILMSKFFKTSGGGYEVEKKQFIIEMTLPLWERLVREHHITEACIC